VLGPWPLGEHRTGDHIEAEEPAAVLIHDREAGSPGPWMTLAGGRRRGHPHADAGSQRQRRSRALGWNSAPSVPGPPIDRRCRNLLRVLQIYVSHDNRRRPHRSRGSSALTHRVVAAPQPVVLQLRRRDVLAGLIHQYERAWQLADFWHPTVMVTASPAEPRTRPRPTGPAGSQWPAGAGTPARAG
jgi:hypothetical protein